MKLLLLACAKPILTLLGVASFLLLGVKAPMHHEAVEMEAIPLQPPPIEEAIPAPVVPAPEPVRPDEDGE